MLALDALSLVHTQTMVRILGKLMQTEHAASASPFVDSKHLGDTSLSADQVTPPSKKFVRDVEDNNPATITPAINPTLEDHTIVML